MDKELTRLKREAKQLKSNKLLWDVLDELEKDYFDNFKGLQRPNGLEHLHAKVKAVDELRDLLNGKIGNYAE